MEVPRDKGRFSGPSSEQSGISLAISVACTLTSLICAIPRRFGIPPQLLDLPEFSCTCVIWNPGDRWG